MFFSNWEILVLECLWDYSEPLSSSDVTKCVNEDKRYKISRASVINFLEKGVNEGYLDYTMTTGKGGHYKLYFNKFDESGLKEFLARHVTNKLLLEWSEEIRSVINGLKS